MDFQAQIEVLEAEVSLLRRNSSADPVNARRLFEAESRLQEALSLANVLDSEISRFQHHAAAHTAHHTQEIKVACMLKGIHVFIIRFDCLLRHCIFFRASKFNGRQHSRQYGRHWSLHGSVQIFGLGWTRLVLKSY
jgi:hypothetical protein